MGGNRKKLRGREKSTVALMLALFITANMIAGDLSSVLVQGAPGDAFVTEITLAEGLDPDQIVFCPGNDYGFQCSLENAGGSEDIEWTVSAEGQTDTAGISITEDGEDQTKAVLHIGEEAKPGTQFTVAASIAETEGSEAKYDEITIADFGSMSVQDIAIWSDLAGADAQELTVTTLEDVNWVNAETAVVKLRNADSGYDQYYSPNTGEWTELTADGMPISGTKQQIRFRNSSSTRISETVELNCDGIGPTVTVTAEPSEEGWTNQQKYKVTANDNEGGSGVKQIYYYDISNPEGTLDSVPDNGEISFSKVEDAGKTLVFYAVDNLDNKGEDSAQYTVNDIDTTPPVVTVTKDGEQLQNQYILNKEDVENGKNVFDVTASEEASGLYTFTYDKGEGSVPVDGVDLSGTDPIFSATGKVTVDITQGETEAKYIYTVSASDKAGNVSESKEINVLYDPVAPVVSFIEMPKVTENGNWISDAMTSDDNKEGIKVNISVSDGENENASGIKSVEYQICAENSDPDDEKWEEIASDDQGNYAVDIKEKAKALVDGNYKIYVRAEDNAENISENAFADFGVDKTAPNVSVEVPNVTENKNWISDAMTSDDNKEGIKVNISASDGENENASGIKSVEYQICEGSSDPDDEKEKWEEITSDGQGNYTVDIKEKVKALVDGNYKICVRAEDNAGNIGSGTYDFTVDRIAPSNISVHVSDTEDENASEDQKLTIWKWINNKWENLVDFITGKETIYIDVYAVDNGSGVGSIECTYTYQESGETKEVTLSGEELGISKEGEEETIYHFGQKVKIQKEIDAQILSVTVMDNAGNKTDIQNPDTDGNIPRFIVDNTDPVISLEYSPAGKTYDYGKENTETGEIEKIGEDITYFNKDTTLTVKVKEDHFDPAKVEVHLDLSDQLETSEDNDDSKVKADVKAYFQAAENWGTEEIDGTTWHVASYEFKDEAQYDVNVDVTDLAGNSAEKVSDTFVIDKTPPEIGLEYSPAGKTYDYGKENTETGEIEKTEEDITYFNKDMTLTVKVKEHNFDPAKVEVDLDLSDQLKTSEDNDDSKVKADVKAYFQVAENWGTEEIDGTTWYVASYESLSDEARYDVTVNVTDLAGNPAEEVSDTFVIDKTEPVISSVKLSPEEGVRTYVKDNDSRIYYSEEVTLEIEVIEHNFYDNNFSTEYALITEDRLDLDLKKVSGVSVETENDAIDALANHINKKTEWVPVVGKEDTYKLKYTFSTDANYTLSKLQLQDLAGNSSVAGDNSGGNFEEKPLQFTIDRTAPDINYKISCDRSILNYLSFGYFGKKCVTITATVKDEISGIYGFTFESVEVEGVDIKRQDASQNNITRDIQLTEKPVGEDTFSWSTPVDAEFNPVDFRGYVSGVAEDYSGNGLDEEEKADIEKGIIVETEDTHERDSSLSLAYDREPNAYGLYNDDVEVTVLAEDSYSGIYSVAYTARTSETAEPEYEENENFWEQENAEIATIYEKTFELDKDTYYSNDVHVYAETEDNAGYINTVEDVLKIDSKKPEISVTYNNLTPTNGNYYNQTRIATVIIDERNFDANRTQLVWTSTGAAPAVSGWTHNGERHTAYVTFSADADYTFTVRSTDLADNVADYSRVDTFTVDQTDPMIQVTYDNNDARNGNYYNAQRTATIQITEHNFNTADVQITGIATENGAGVTFPSASGWSTSGDVHMATITYSQDAHYIFDIAYTDMAGNAAADYQEEQFAVDQTAPELVIRGVQDESANNADQIGFVITASDNNFGTMTPRLTASVRDENNNFSTVEIPLENEQISGTSHSYTVENLEDDGIYSLTCTVVDMAGNTCERVTLQDNDGNTYAEMSYPGTEESLLEFSVNRLGSAYRIIVNPEGINNGITNAEADDISVRIEEINVDELEEGSTRLDLYNGIAAKQIQLVPGVNYETGEAEGSGGWRMYTYTLDGENFVDDGNYQVGVYSVDKAGNESDSALDEKAKISFIVDRTAPELSVNVKSRTSYDTVEKVVELNITELHLDKSGVAVEVNGKPQDIQETAAGQYEFTLKSGMNQSVSVVCTDQAGNKTELSEDRITVSTNIMVRAGAWIVNNLMIFLAIVFVLLLLIILIIVWRVNERRKRRIETEDE